MYKDFYIGKREYSNKPYKKLIINIGLPGAGKSYWSAKEQNKTTDMHIAIESDIATRIICGLDLDDNLYDKEVKETTLGFIDKLLNDPYNGIDTVIYDSRNLHRKQRMKLIERFKGKAQIIYNLFMTPYETCLERIGDRVPEEEWIRMRNSFELPSCIEPYDELHVVLCDKPDNYVDPMYIFTGSRDFMQDTKYHRETLHDHLRRTHKYLQDHDSKIARVGLWHDLGKYYTKTFTNHKGETTEDAHYIGHDNVSAYLYLLDHLYYNRFSFNEVYYETDLISWHMLLYKDEKYINKIKDIILRVNPRMWKDLEDLHEADLASREMDV